MKKFFVNVLCWFAPTRAARRKIRRYFIPPKPSPMPESKLAHKYLDGLNGIEIGGSAQNPFGLEKTGGYANIDYSADQGGKWQDASFPPKQVNIVASGDNLPFKDGVLDYVVSSHCIEHFFDPIGAIKEWLRVVRRNGFVIIVVPHKERTFDKLRPLSSAAELQKRHGGEIRPSDYLIKENQEMSYIQGLQVLPADCQIMGKNKRQGYRRGSRDDHHHWCVWDFNSFTDMIKHCKFNMVDSMDPDDKIGNGFIVVLKK